MSNWKIHLNSKDHRTYVLNKILACVWVVMFVVTLHSYFNGNKIAVIASGLCSIYFTLNIRDILKLKRKYTNKSK